MTCPGQLASHIMHVTCTLLANFTSKSTPFKVHTADVSPPSPSIALRILKKATLLAQCLEEAGAFCRIIDTDLRLKIALREIASPQVAE